MPWKFLEDYANNPILRNFNKVIAEQKINPQQFEIKDADTDVIKKMLLALNKDMGTILKSLYENPEEAGDLFSGMTRKIARASKELFAQLEMRGIQFEVPDIFISTKEDMQYLANKTRSDAEYLEKLKEKKEADMSEVEKQAIKGYPDLGLFEPAKNQSGTETKSDKISNPNEQSSEDKSKTKIQGPSGGKKS